MVDLGTYFIWNPRQYTVQFLVHHCTHHVVRFTLQIQYLNLDPCRKEIARFVSTQNFGEFLRVYDWGDQRV